MQILNRVGHRQPCILDGDWGADAPTLNCRMLATVHFHKLWHGNAFDNLLILLVHPHRP